MKRMICLMITLLMISVAGISAAETPDFLRDILVSGYCLEDNEMLDAFIAFYSLTDEDLRDKNIPYLYDQFVADAPYQNPLMDELTQEDLENDNDADLKNPASLLVCLNEDNQAVVTLFDFDHHAVYTGNGAFLHDPSAGRRSCMNAAREAEIISALVSWDPFRPRMANAVVAGEEHPRWTAWSLVVKDTEGRICRTFQAGSNTESFSEGWHDLLQILLAAPENT